MQEKIMTKLHNDIFYNQTEMQLCLNELYQTQGLNIVLNALFDWSLAVRYITPAKLNDNKRYTYYDNQLGVTFKTQINIARSLYSPKPIQGANIPKLHCPICIDNLAIPGKENLRVFEFELSKGRGFFLQLTPFPLYPYHFVLVAQDKIPMIMEEQSIADLMDFITLAPGFVGCSNSDVEWAGASVLVHHHYQVFKDLDLPIMEARFANDCHTVDEVLINGEAVIIEFGLLEFPIACCKLVMNSASTIIELGGQIIQQWKDKDRGRNTCNLILCKINDSYELYIIFRNPDFRTPPSLTHIKSEGVGIIEVAGEGIYPLPHGPDADKLWHEIEHNGLAIIKGIIEGNNPIKYDQFSEQFAEISQLFSKTRK